jgi:hypothetical protein
MPTGWCGTTISVTDLDVLRGQSGQACVAHGVEPQQLLRHRVDADGACRQGRAEVRAGKQREDAECQDLGVRAFQIVRGGRAREADRGTGLAEVVARDRH